MALHVNTFKSGLDLDTTVNEYDNTHYPYALNLRLLTDNNQASGTLTSMEDSEIVLTVSSSITIVKLVTLRDNLIIFANKTNLTPYNDGVIYYIPFSELNSSINIEDYEKVTKKFAFESNMPVIARYETPEVQKIYWVGGIIGENPTNKYFFNLNLAANNLNSIDIDKFKLVPKVNLSTPVLTSMIYGNLKVGVVQYAYCLFNINGAETAYSPTTCPIPISTSSLTEANSNDFKGANIGEISNSGCSITISNIDTNFDMIRVIRLFYAEQNNTPEIDIIHEGDVLSTLIVNDTGSTLGSITINDYRYIPNIFSAETLETKNNYLFAGNITEETFDIDFDARAYRFNNIGIAALFKSDLTPEYYLDAASPDWDSIPETADCINHYNITEQDSTRISEYNCQYRIDGSIGGSGKYVNYGFVARDRELDDSTTALKVYTNNSTSPLGYHDLSNPLMIQQNLGYQRDDIYRFAIVLYDKYGRQSFAKWIGDIRIISESGGWFFALNGEGNLFREIGLKFWLNQTAVDYLQANDVVGWQVVRADRTYQDATVKDCGYIGQIVDGYKSNDVRFGPRPIIETVQYGVNLRSTKVVEYITPETNYNKNNTNPYNRLDTYEGGLTIYEHFKNTDTSDACTIGIVKYTGCSIEAIPKTYDIKNSLLFTYNPDISTISLASLNVSYQLSNKVNFGPTYSHFCSKGTTLLLELNEAPVNTYTYKAVYARRRTYTYPYGGASYNFRTTTQYYPCSEIFSLDILIKEVFQGDCYIGWFEYNRGIWCTDTKAIDSAHKYGAQIAFLFVETKINLKYTTNPKWSQLDDGFTKSYKTSEWIDTHTYDYIAMREKAGIYKLHTDNDKTYTQNFDLYTYNPVYSQMNKSKVFLSKPLNYTANNIIDSRIYRTDKKINGENSDTWSKFPVNNLLDLDTMYGSLNKLLTFNNQLLYFQDKCIGTIPIEEKEIVTTNSGSATSIGTGGVMTRYDYITTNSGCTESQNVITSNKAVYYIDSLNKKICRLGQEIEFLSDVQGVKSFVNNATYSNLNTLFNPNFNEIWFKFNTDIIIFNEYLNGFITFTDESFVSPVYYNNQVYTLSTDLKNLNKLNDTNIYKSSKLHLYINPDNVFTDRFDSLTVSSTVDRDNVIQDKSFTNIGLENKYQTKSLSTFYPPARKRMRQFIYNTMREDATNERLIDTHLKVILEFNPQYTNERIKVFDIITNYTPINNR